MKISGCIIARNEEANIARCINKLKSVTDEIILVDTGSEDDTIQIAKELGAFVYEHKWEKDFSKAKNAALEHAKGDWIIFLDVDEYFSEDSLLKVRSAIENAHSNPSTEGMLCNLINIDLDSGRLIDNISVMRIFRNRKQFRFINKIHEQISNMGMNLKYANHSDIITIIHTGYSPTLQIDKARRNLEILLKDPDQTTVAYHLAITYFILHDFENAYQYADLALSAKAVREADNLAYKMHFYKIFIALMGPDNAKIESLIKEAKLKYGNYPEIAKLEGAYYLREKHYGKAYEKYMHALNCQNQYEATLGQNSFEAAIHEVYLCIAHILSLMNKEADAFDYYLKAIRANKYHKGVFYSMFLLFMTMPETETIAFINSLYDISKEEDVRFIISQIAGCGLSRIVLYYADKWNNVFGHEDDVLIYAFLAQGKYDTALQIALLYLKTDRNKYSSLVTSVLILGGLFQEADLIREDIGSDYYDLVKCFSKGDRYSACMDTYLSVLSILINHADENVLNEYLEAADVSDAKLIKGICEAFLGARQYNHSISYSERLFELCGGDGLKAMAAFQTGYCYYKLMKHKESIDWFEKAIKKGYAENDLMEFLLWIAEQTQDEAVKRKIETLTGMTRTDCME